MINDVRIIVPVSLRFPGLCLLGQGELDSKSRSIDVGDGKQVNIPVPLT